MNIRKFIHSSQHRYTTGISYTYDRYNTAYSDSLEFNSTPLTEFRHIESVPGVFAEYTHSNSTGWTFVLGFLPQVPSRNGG